MTILDETPRDLVVTGRDVAFEPLRPVLYGRAPLWWCTRGHLLDDVRKDARCFFVASIDRHAHEGLAWRRAFEEYRSLDVLINPNNSVAPESLQYFAGVPLVPLALDDFQYNWLMAAGAEREDRAFRLRNLIDSQTPLPDQIVDSSSQFGCNH